MNREQYEVMSWIASEFDYQVTPQPQEDENVRFFDIVSETTGIAPSKLLNRIHEASTSRREVGLIPQLVAAQSHCLTFEDLGV